MNAVKIGFFIVLIPMLLIGCTTNETKLLASHEVAMKQKPYTVESYLRDEMLIVGLGDSLTEGVGDKEERGYIDRVKEKFEKEGHSDIELANYAVEGDKTTNMMKRLKEEETKKKIEDADMIFITIGANDIMYVFKKNVFQLDYEKFMEDQSSYKKRLNQILSYIRDVNSNAFIVFLSLYNPFSYLVSDIPEIELIMSDYNQLSKQVVSNYNPIYFVSIDDIFNFEPTLLSDDLFHPNEEGYSNMADRILDTIHFNDGGE
ncbi:GDSL-type esterase/lipase family protein [Bacillus carboniphilus]|uniref:GDSL-type esterase/lipase family protein n=1 Tax=Bacillus carboniphilus TaxID=86663 RepID=A0ABY9JW98_9BACI|nr:GDSL-type esterase/lipase family protein [Bacillus carboniphilus]WLR43669.1 GDSL-type esterase/lipase family protein [Bacillus carboniphilus]